jgi:hypothetical protein
MPITPPLSCADARCGFVLTPLYAHDSRARVRLVYFWPDRLGWG